MGEKRNAYWWERQKERDHEEDQDVGGWTILKLILERKYGVVWTGLIWLRVGGQWSSLVITVMNLRVP
jgi:hypothetical protein